jgi:hypothetical protein
MPEQTLKRHTKKLRYKEALRRIGGLFIFMRLNIDMPKVPNMPT